MLKKYANKQDDRSNHSSSKHIPSSTDKDDLLSNEHLQDCLGSREKQTFPDIDYTFFGYNISKGYPHAIGHDPGFTYPIFETDYSEKRQSGDCRYFIPRGLVVVPDVSCALSFSSKTVKNMLELSQALSVSTSVHGGGWGVNFSASAGYKESSNEMSSGESIYIFSKAKCRYYFTKMLTENPPPFTIAFLDWVFKLNSTNTKETYIDFFETFGTHYTTYTSFGSRFTYQYKMSSKSYQSEKENGFNVEVAASYSGLFSAGADFNMDSSQKAAASRFSELVETKTITVGASPPEDGKASTWASTVKDNPVPIEYSLESIENLFTKNFMSRLDVDCDRIRYNIKEYISRLEYCKHLKNTGQLDTCEIVRPGFSKIKTLKKTRLYYHYKRVNFSTLKECAEMCLKEIKCKAITHCVHYCNDDYCYMYDHGGWNTKWKSDKAYNPSDPNVHWFDVAGIENKEWQSAVFSTKIQQPMIFNATNIKGVFRSSFSLKEMYTQSSCNSRCENDDFCAAYTFSSSADTNMKCHLYTESGIQGLFEDFETNTYFITSVKIPDSKLKDR
ncbi:uncharacterized protein LOC127712245 [Mytilus californianus]|uniref:uncharacterized protein LOC127712245 n=1 Tax=Mytilus californianus TaxID=6549 RepID=UPI0022466AF6|nr:uncharacterized protein LOC127712245 [Mytilus californianus]